MLFSTTGRQWSGALMAMGFLLILLLTPPYSHQNIETALSLAEAALRKNHRCQVHLMMDGVHNANKKINCDKTSNIDCNYAERLEGLIGKGVEVTICPVCSSYRGLPDEDFVDGATSMSMTALADRINSADAFVSLGE